MKYYRVEYRVTGQAYSNRSTTAIAEHAGEVLGLLQDYWEKFKGLVFDFSIISKIDLNEPKILGHE